MSVDVSICLGVYMDVVNLGIDSCDDQYDQYNCGYEGEVFSIIDDGMCGEYTYFGKTFNEINIEEMYSYTLYNLEQRDIEAEKREVYNKAIEVFGERVQNLEVKYILFNHCS